MHRQFATADVIGRTVTLTRQSPLTGRTFTQDYVIESSWDTYNGTAVGMPVVLAGGIGRRDVLTPAEQTTIR